jgi:hypothetical protein
MQHRPRADGRSTILWSIWTVDPMGETGDPTSVRPTTGCDVAPNPGTYPFQPSTIGEVLRSGVVAFAPTGKVDPSITFTDLDRATPSTP